jgi:hypothetical protein
VMSRLAFDNGKLVPCVPEVRRARRTTSGGG